MFEALLVSQQKKEKHFSFALYSAFTNLPLRGEYRMRLNNERKNFVIFFALSSAFTNLAGAQYRMRLNNERKNFVIFFALSSAFTIFAKEYLRTVKT